MHVFVWLACTPCDTATVGEGPLPGSRGPAHPQPGASRPAEPGPGSQTTVACVSVAVRQDARGRGKRGPVRSAEVRLWRFLQENLPLCLRCVWRSCKAAASSVMLVRLSLEMGQQDRLTDRQTDEANVVNVDRWDPGSARCSLCGFLRFLMFEIFLITQESVATAVTAVTARWRKCAVTVLRGLH